MNWEGNLQSGHLKIHEIFQQIIDTVNAVNVQKIFQEIFGKCHLKLNSSGGFSEVHEFNSNLRAMSSKWTFENCTELNWD